MSESTIRSRIIRELFEHPYMESDMCGPDDISPEANFLAVTCYGDSLEINRPEGYATIEEAESALSEGGNSSAWAIIDLTADSLDTAYRPLQFTVKAERGMKLDLLPTPDH